MVTTIKKWGNSLAVRLPKKAADRAGIREGSEVVIDESGAREYIRCWKFYFWE